MKKTIGYYVLLSLGIICCAILALLSAVKSGLRNDAKSLGFAVFFGILASLLLHETGSLSSTGTPRESLPHGKTFYRIAARAEEQGRVVFLWLSTSSPQTVNRQIYSFKIASHLLLDGNGGGYIESIPEKFRVGISKRVVVSQKYFRRPKTEKIYYLFAIGNNL